MMKKQKLLFICTFNRMRSKTAEMIYKDDERFEVKSAGTDEAAAVHVNLDLLAWADYIIVMEGYHLEWLRLQYPMLSAHKTILCLDIPDQYDFMSPFLVYMIKEKMAALFTGI